ncbi:MAG TPA: isochorismatase family protein [Caulobacteraceae bacterium]|nr:isochorismatase family protein [Caulobacteraceae bacterium]
MIQLRTDQAPVVRHLVCLDLVRGARPLSPEAQLRIDRCRRLLTYARTTEWTISHVYPHTAGRSTKPLAGLEPRPIEAVYYRTGASAFSNRVFRHAVKEDPDLELVILSLSLSSTSLGTALSAHDHDIAVVLIEDTLRPDAANASGLEAIKTITHALVAPFVQIRKVDDVIDQRRGLRLVQL